ncbi:hypothetical protein L2E82_51987 [Cichorium intybus]|nr:hypothetical protein L2E82_51987 [Cichorium intybus]
MVSGSSGKAPPEQSIESEIEQSIEFVKLTDTMFGLQIPFWITDTMFVEVSILLEQSIESEIEQSIESEIDDRI